MRPALLLAAAIALLGCTSDGREAPGTSAQPAFCEPGVRDCPPLPGYAVQCEAGVCVARSPAGDVRADCRGVGGYPEALADDPRHCGACGRACAPGEACSASVCVACSGGQAACDGACRDLASDANHCGVCSVACSAAAACVRGVCSAPRPTPQACTGGQMRCGGTCRDLATDPDHCGACGVACGPGERCEGATCRAGCPPPRLRCGDRCVDLSADAAHCGACSNACGPADRCAAGTCVAACAAGTTSCEGSCADLQSDRYHCGRCGAQCPVDARCVGGRCVVSCPSGATDCGGTCRELQRDANHCGACGAQCPADALCTAGACVRCGAGLTACDAACVDVQTSAAHCGACRHECPSRSTCVQGRCGLPCAEDPLTCTEFMTCGVTFEVSVNHCGACGVRCPTDAICFDGRCLRASPRMKAPVSTAIVTSARPWFRWEPEAGADGVRIEVCPTRACDRVEHRWDATGESLRAPEALRGGVHYWRVLARRGGVVSPPGGVVWEFVVPDAPVAAGAPEGALCDINGDGILDRFVARAIDGLDGALDVYLGSPSGPSTSPSQVVPLLHWGGVMGPSISTWNFDPTYVGDLNGDGYGDVGGVRVERHYDAYMRDDWFDHHPVILFGGPRGLRPTQHFGAVTNGSWGYPLQSMSYAGDRNSDGYGDTAYSNSDSAYLHTALFGGLSLQARIVALESPCYGTPGGLHFGDFDADGATEAVAGCVRASWGPGPLRVYRGLRDPASSRSSPTWLSGCGFSTLSVEAARDAVRVADLDDDGYDDLVLWTGATPTARVVFRGGATGLQSDRCERFP